MFLGNGEITMLYQDEVVSETPPIPNVNNVIISNKIKSELFKQLGGKPPGYRNIEIKTICPCHSYRVNLVCKDTTHPSMMESYIRPLSYYVINVADGLVFSPPIIPIL